MNIEQRIRALEQRIDALSAPETSSPPNGLKILPNGEVVFEFEGKIVATGLSLKELEAELESNRIEWVPSAGAEPTELIEGYRLGGSHLLRLKAGNVLGTFKEKVQLWLESDGANEGELKVWVGEVSRVLFKGLGEKSEFMQLTGLRKARTAYGTLQAEWPGGSAASNALVVKHGLGAVPESYMATMAGYPFFWGITANTGEPTAESFIVKAEFTSGFAPPKGTKISVCWVAIG